MWTIQLPLRVRVSKRKQFSLNLNQYRNAHHFTLDKAKKIFEKSLKDQVKKRIPPLKRCSLEYVLYPGTSQLCDTNNICSIVDKFFSDVLVGAGILPDDNYNFIIESRFRFGGVDRTNPRVEAIVRDLSSTQVPLEPFTEREGLQHMKITTHAVHHVVITQDDLVAALKEHLAKHITLAEDVTFNPLIQQEDGSYLLRIEQGMATAAAPAPKTRTPRRSAPKLEPKEGVQAAVKAIKKEPEPEPELEEEQDTEEAQPEEDEVPEEFDHSPKNPEEEEVVEETVDEEPAEKKPSKRKAPSLFGGYTRPKN